MFTSMGTSFLFVELSHFRRPSQTCFFQHWWLMGPFLPLSRQKKKLIVSRWRHQSSCLRYWDKTSINTKAVLIFLMRWKHPVKVVSWSRNCRKAILSLMRSRAKSGEQPSVIKVSSPKTDLVIYVSWHMEEPGDIQGRSEMIDCNGAAAYRSNCSCSPQAYM